MTDGVPINGGLSHGVVADSDTIDGTPINDECKQALDRVYEFLDHEMDEASCDDIRAHLAACEPCLDRFDTEQVVKTLVGRCCGDEVAPDTLRSKIKLQILIAKKRTS